MRGCRWPWGGKVVPSRAEGFGDAVAPRCQDPPTPVAGTTHHPGPSPLTWLPALPGSPGQALTGSPCFSSEAAGIAMHQRCPACMWARRRVPQGPTQTWFLCPPQPAAPERPSPTWASCRAPVPQRVPTWWVLDRHLLLTEGSGPEPAGCPPPMGGHLCAFQAPPPEHVSHHNSQVSSSRPLWACKDPLSRVSQMLLGQPPTSSQCSDLTSSLVPPASCGWPMCVHVCVHMRVHMLVCLCSYAWAHLHLAPSQTLSKVELR